MTYQNKCIFFARHGFTLIELLVVISFIGILTSLGIASYSSYNAEQIINSNASNVQTLLNEAKSKAISQVVPSSCGTNPLTGYEVAITAGGQQYTLSAICGSPNVITTNRLTPPLEFATGSTTSVFFNVGTGSANNSANFLVTGYGQTIAVITNSSGLVTVQPNPTPTITVTP